MQYLLTIFNDIVFFALYLYVILLDHLLIIWPLSPVNIFLVPEIATSLF